MDPEYYGINMPDKMFSQGNSGMAVMGTTSTLIKIKVYLQEIVTGYCKLSKTLWLGKNSQVRKLLIF